MVTFDTATCHGAPATHRPPTGRPPPTHAPPPQRHQDVWPGFARNGRPARPSIPSTRARKALCTGSSPSLPAGCAISANDPWIYPWRRQGRIDRGFKPGVTSVEKAELTVTKRRGAALETALLAIHEARNGVPPAGRARPDRRRPLNAAAPSTRAVECSTSPYGDDEWRTRKPTNALWNATHRTHTDRNRTASRPELCARVPGRCPELRHVTRPSGTTRASTRSGVPEPHAVT